MEKGGEVVGSLSKVKWRDTARRDRVQSIIVLLLDSEARVHYPYVVRAELGRPPPACPPRPSELQRYISVLT